MIARHVATGHAHADAIISKYRVSNGSTTANAELRDPTLLVSTLNDLYGNEVEYAQPVRSRSVDAWNVGSAGGNQALMNTSLPRCSPQEMRGDEPKSIPRCRWSRLPTRQFPVSGSGSSYVMKPSRSRPLTTTTDFWAAGGDGGVSRADIRQRVTLHLGQRRRSAARPRTPDVATPPRRRPDPRSRNPFASYIESCSVIPPVNRNPPTAFEHRSSARIQSCGPIVAHRTQTSTRLPSHFAGQLRGRASPPS